MAAKYGEVFGHFVRRRDWLDFMGKRIARLYPLHLFTLMIVIPLMLDKYSDVPSQTFLMEFLMNIFMIHSWGSVNDVTFNFPSWSISVEFGVYILFPFIWAFLFGRRLRLVVLAAVIGGYGAIWLMQSGLEVAVELRIFRGLLGFSLGMLAFSWRSLGRIRSDTVMAVAQIATAVTLVALMARPGPVGPEVMPAVALLTVLLHQDRGPVAWALARPSLVWLGDVSYSIYMLHMPVFWMMKAVLMRVGLFDREAIAEAPLVAGAPVIAICLLILLPLGHLSLRWLENPGRRRLSHAFRRTKMRGAA
jgi:peptidoglycan/LPS O-acetylase OafA/YrhL